MPTPLAPRTLALWLLLALGGCRRRAVELEPGLLLSADFEDSREADALVPLDCERSGQPSFDEGLDGRALRFDGEGAAVSYEGVEALSLTEGFTLELFLNADGWRNPYANRQVLESLVHCGDGLGLALQPDSWMLSAQLTLTGAEPALVGGLVVPGSWHHVALVHDPAAGVARLVFDGEVVAEAPRAGALHLSADVPLRLGTRAGRDQAYAGRIDRLRLWDRPLPLQDLRARAALVPGAHGS